MEPVTERISKKSAFWKLISLLFFIILIYNSTFYWIFQRYTESNNFYTHGYLVPFVSGYLIWLKRKKLKMEPRGGSLGLILIICALSFHLLGMLAQVFFISGFSLLLLTIGIVLFLFGSQVTKKVIFPLSFLVFMFPLPLVAVNAITYPLKRFVAKGVVFIFGTLMHIPVQREGSLISFSRGSLLIDDSCSGLRSLFVILAVTSILFYLFKKSSFPKKITFLFLSAIIALFFNLIRVCLLSLAVYLYGNQAIQGFFHEFTGYLISAITFLALCLLWRYFKWEDSA